jgi:hypothetical protein
LDLGRLPQRRAMAVTSAVIAAQDAATQVRARAMLEQLAEVHRSPRGLEIPIAYFIGMGNARSYQADRASA